MIQVESLIKFPEAECSNSNFCDDLVVLAEIESILYQFSSTTNKNVCKAFQVFLQILHNASAIIMADAFVTKRTVELCKSIKMHIIRVPIKTIIPSSSEKTCLTQIQIKKPLLRGLQQTRLLLNKQKQNFFK